MAEQPELVVVITTVDTEAAALSLAGGAVVSGLAACAQLGTISSIYRWQGELAHESEIRVELKTSAARVVDLMAWIEAEHPYEVPEILVLPTLLSSAAYRAWVIDQTVSQPAPERSKSELEG